MNDTKIEFIPVFFLFIAVKLKFLYQTLKIILLPIYFLHSFKHLKNANDTKTCPYIDFHFYLLLILKLAHMQPRHGISTTLMGLSDF